MPRGKKGFSVLLFLRTPNDNDRVGLIFHLPSLTIICQVLKGWTLAAGIKNKKVTFHLARHIFATLSLALGIDLYTVCKLLGHKNIISTQVYAKIIDASKRQAIDRFNGVLDAWRRILLQIRMARIKKDTSPQDPCHPL